MLRTNRDMKITGAMARTVSEDRMRPTIACAMPRTSAEDAELPVPGQGERVSRHGNQAHAPHQGRGNAKLGAARGARALAGGQHNDMDHGKDQGPQ